MTTLQIALPEEVRDKVCEAAEQQHLSLEQFAAMALMEKLSHIPDQELEKRAACGRREDFDAFLALARDVPPEDYDRLQ